MNHCDEDVLYSRFLTKDFLELCKKKLIDNHIEQIIEDKPEEQIIEDKPIDKDNELVQIVIPEKAKNWNTKIECTCGQWVLKSNMPTHRKRDKCKRITEANQTKNLNLIPYLEYMEKIRTSDKLSENDKNYVIDVIKKKIDNLLS